MEAGYSPSFYLDIKLRPFLVLSLLQFGICVPVNCYLLHNFFATFRLITSVTTGTPILEERRMAMSQGGRILLVLHTGPQLLFGVIHPIPCINEFASNERCREE